MLKLWLPFIDGLKQQGISNATVENMGGVSAAAAGKIGACMSFTGAANSYLRLPPILDANSDCTIAFWVKFNNVSTNQCIFSQRVEAQANGYTIFLLGTGIRFDEGAQATYGTVAANTWYHIACCKDASKKYIYINGILVGSTTRTTQSAEKVNTNYSLIGGSQNSTTGTPSQGTTNALNGYLNDFRIYDNCLSAAEVKEIAQGLVLHYKLDGFQGGYGNPNIIVTHSNAGVDGTGTSGWSAAGTGWSNSFVSATSATGGHAIRCTYANTSQTSGGIHHPTGIDKTTLTTGDIYTLSARIRTSKACVVTFQNELMTTGHSINATTEWQTYTYTCAIDTSKTYQSNVMYVRAADAVQNMWIECDWIKLEKGTAATPWQPSGVIGTAIQDSSGYNHNGSILNDVLISSDTPRYSTSTNLVAGNSAINCGRGGMVTDSITVNLWLKSSGWGNPVSCTEGGGWNFESSGNGFRFPVYLAGVGYKAAGVTTTTRAQLCNNQWHMITGVYDRLNQKIRVYIDANLEYEENTSSSALIGYHGSNVIWIGAEASGSATAIGSNGMAGLFSDFRIYCTPLLDTDIKQLYNVGMKVDKKQSIHAFEFNETVGRTQFLKTGVIKSAQVADNLLFDNKAHIGKHSYENILPNNVNIVTTKNGHITNQNTLASIPAEKIQSLAGKTLRFTYDVKADGTRSSTENNQTAWNYIRYGIHATFQYTNASGTTGTSYPFAGDLAYSGVEKRSTQTWTVPTGYQSYGALGFSIQTFDKPASTNNETWFIQNVRLEVIDNTIDGYVTGTQLIEK